MKELQQRIVDDTSNVLEQRPVIKNEVLVRLRPRKGHRCYEMNLATGQVEEAEVVETAAILTHDPHVPKVVKKVLIKPNCIYTTALNKQNAFRHLIKQIQSANTKHPEK